MLKNLLLELYSEELPHTEQIKAEQNYKTIFENGLREKNIQFKKVNVFSTCLRITIFIEEIVDEMILGGEEIKGPKVSTANKAIIGFCKKNKVKKENLSIKSYNNESYYVLSTKDKKIKSINVLKDLIPILIDKQSWNKSILCPISGAKWPRPLKNILCIYEDDIVLFKYYNLHANNATFGNKFLSNTNRLIINSFEEYKQALSDNYVMLEREKRKQHIIQHSKVILSKYNLALQLSESLLETSASHFEHPTVMLGKIDKNYLQHLPKDVIITTLQHHQKYFVTTQHDQKNLAPYFLFISNNLGKNAIGITKGHETCASARLQDSQFILNQELNISLEEKLKNLSKIIFHEKLGSIADKVERLKNIAKKIHIYKCSSITEQDNKDNNISYDLQTALTEAIKYCKNDLASEIVDDMPNLRGKIAAFFYKTQHKSFNNTAELLIKHQYENQCDNNPNFCLLLSLIDKIDNIVGLFLAGERVTGSKDKHNMRKQMLQIISILFAFSQSTQSIFASSNNAERSSHVTINNNAQDNYANNSKYIATKQETLAENDNRQQKNNIKSSTYHHSSNTHALNNNFDFIVKKNGNAYTKQNILEYLIEICIQEYVLQNTVSTSQKENLFCGAKINACEIKNEILHLIKLRHVNILKHTFDMPIIQAIFGKSNLYNNILSNTPKALTKIEKKYKTYNVELFTSFVEQLNTLIQNRENVVYKATMLFKRANNIITQALSKKMISNTQTIIDKNINNDPLLNNLSKTLKTNLQKTTFNSLLTYLNNVDEFNVHIKTDVENLQCLIDYANSMLDSEKIYDEKGILISEEGFCIILLIACLLNNIIAFEELFSITLI